MLKFVTKNTELVDHKILSCLIREDSYYVRPEISQSLKRKKEAFRLNLIWQLFQLPIGMLGSTYHHQHRRTKQQQTIQEQRKREKNGSPTYRSNCTRYFSVFRDVTYIEEMCSLVFLITENSYNLVISIINHIRAACITLTVCKLSKNKSCIRT